MPDVDRSIELLNSMLGWGPWSIYELVPPRLQERRYRDERGSFGMIGAETHVGPIDFALNQALTGPSIYEEYLARGGEGLHHLACMSGGPDGGLHVRDHFAAAGIGVTMKGTIDQTVEFFYFDTEPALGVAIESGNGHAISLRPDRIFPAAGDPVLNAPAALSEISIVVNDVKEATQSYTRLLGWGPWDVRELGPSDLEDVRRDGTPVEYTASTARTNVGPIVLELFQPRTGPSIEGRTIEARGAGLHHIACGLELGDMAPMRDLLEERGIKIEVRGRLDGAPFWYLDTNPRLKLLFMSGANMRPNPRQPSSPYPEESP